jgi:hypothetical protein
MHTYYGVTITPRALTEYLKAFTNSSAHTQDYKQNSLSEDEITRVRSLPQAAAPTTNLV